MNNNSFGFNLYRSAKNRNFEVRILDRKSGNLKVSVPLESTDHYVEIYYLGRLIFTDKDGENRFFTSGLRTKTVNQAIGKIMIEVGIGRYSVRNIRGQLWVIKDHRRICKFVDGITLTEIDKAEDFKDRKIKALLKAFNERQRLKNDP